MTDLGYRTATEVAGLVRGGQVSSRELTELVLARIDAVNPALNAVVALRRDEVLDEAAEADRALHEHGAAGVGPLHGVPITVKEAFDVAGLATTWGEPVFAGAVAGRDATVVRRLRRAGAIVVGKTNVPAMLGDFGHSANEVYGRTRNPWDLERSPGGSSGGAAAAVAAGLSFLDYGSDLVGSIRIPAAFCGVYGLRPSRRTVPLTGFAPPGPPAPPTEISYLSSVGPLGRSAADLRAALAATAGPERPEAVAYTWTLPAPRRSRLRDVRVGVVLDHPAAPVSGPVAGPLSDAVDALARADATVVEGWPDGVDPVRAAASFGFHVQLFFSFHGPGSDFAKLTEVVEHENYRMAVCAAWESCFRDIDVFLCPVNFTPPYPHDSRPFEERTVTTPEGERPYHDQVFWTAQPALPGLPALAAPVGQTPAGLPVGVQIIGPMFEDDTAITVAELLGEVTGGYRRPPGR